jgi:hypothetical protein
MFGRHAPGWSRPWREDGALDRDFSRLDLAPLFDPAIPAAVEHRHGLVTVVEEGPPKARGELAPHVIDGHDVRFVADPPRGHRLGEPLGTGELRGDRVLQVHDVQRPIDVDGPRDVAREILAPGAAIRGFFDTFSDLFGNHISAHVHDAAMRVFQVLGQPVGGHEWVGGHRALRLVNGLLPWS